MVEQNRDNTVTDKYGLSNFNFKFLLDSTPMKLPSKLGVKWATITQRKYVILYNVQMTDQKDQ